MSLELIEDSRKFWKNITVVPSEKIYYGRYPYRANLQFPIAKRFVDKSNNWEEWIEQNRSIRLQLWNYANDIDDFCSNIFNSGWRTYFRENVQRIYIRNYEDFVNLCHFYKPYLESVAGPKTEEHLEILRSTDTEFSNRKTPFFKKYNCVMHVIPPWGPGKIQNRRNTIDEVLEFIKGSISEDKLRVGRSHYYCAKTYINYNDYEDLAPFIKLSFPECSVRLTRCCLPSLESDKYYKQK